MLMSSVAIYYSVGPKEAKKFDTPALELPNTLLLQKIVCSHLAEKK